MKINVWHGTNQTFEAFSRDRLGMANDNSASRLAFFFSAHPETAWEYAQGAARKLLPDQESHEKKIKDLVVRAGKAERRGDYGLYEDLLLKAEELEAQARDAEPQGHTLLLCEVSFQNPYEVWGKHREMMINLGDVLAGAKGCGFDAVIIREIIDTPSGHGPLDDHYAIFDPSAIKIIGRFSSIPTASDPFIDTPPPLLQEPAL